MTEICQKDNRKMSERCQKDVRMSECQNYWQTEWLTSMGRQPLLEEDNLSPRKTTSPIGSRPLFLGRQPLHVEYNLFIWKTIGSQTLGWGGASNDLSISIYQHKKIYRPKMIVWWLVLYSWSCLSKIISYGFLLCSTVIGLDLESHSHSREKVQFFETRLRIIFLALAWRDEIEIIIWPFSYFETRTRFHFVTLMFRDEIETSENHFSWSSEKNEADSRREFPGSRILADLCLRV